MTNKSIEAFEALAEASKQMSGGGALCVSITACHDEEKKGVNVNFGANGFGSDIANMLVNTFHQIMLKPDETLAKAIALAIALSNDMAVKHLLGINNYQQKGEQAND